MTRLVLAAMWGLMVVNSAAGQELDALRFEVVTVRQNNDVGRAGAISALTGSRFTVTNIPLRAILLYAYELREVQLVGAPSWTETTKFDIAAKFPEGTLSPAERRLILQNMLADHFGLVVHRETREVPVFKLVMAREDRRLGPKLVPSDVDCAKWFAEKRSQIIGQGPIGPGGARPACMMVANRNYILAGTRTTAQLARALESVVGRAVVDETGLTGAFDMDVQWVPEPGVDAAFQGPLVAAPSASGSVFTALQEQLGLKLESARRPVDVLVVTSIKRPVEE